MSNNSKIGSYVLQGGRDHKEDRHYATKSMTPINELDAAYLLSCSINEINGKTFLADVGSTFTGAIITADCKVVTAHLGDSPAAVFIFDPESYDVESIFRPDEEAIRIRRLITPHTPSQEEQRFQRLGTLWKEENGRLFLEGIEHDIGINRALGDNDFGGAISKQLALGTHDFSQEIEAGKRVFLVVASDGVGDLKDHKETIAEMIAKGRSFKDIAQELCKKSKETGDNVTVLFTEMKPNQSAVLAVFDGHGLSHGDVVSKEARHLFMESVERRKSSLESTPIEQKIEHIIASQLTDYLLPILRLDAATDVPMNIKEAQMYFSACTGDNHLFKQAQADLMKAPNYAQDTTLFTRDAQGNVFTKFQAETELKLPLSRCAEAKHFRNGNVEEYQFTESPKNGLHTSYRIVSLEDAQYPSRYYEMKTYESEGNLVSFSAAMQSGDRIAKNITIAKDANGKYGLKTSEVLPFPITEAGETTQDLQPPSAKRGV